MRRLAAALTLGIGVDFASHSGGAAQQPPPGGMAAAAARCELRALDARSQRELSRWPLNPAAAEVRLAFEHSVLGTTVIDRYRFTPDAVLVEEEFEGEGYGLPAAPGPDEQLLREGKRQRLLLHRPVVPLTLRSVPSQRMRLLLPQGEVLLASLGAASVTLEAVGCSAPARKP
ncbi:MAG: DUF1850 domain-containing protein [Betaproteobacteria bacterium]|nr:DUF1850 domain-containing protein [Betaproteobacteria bacterium]